MPSTSGKNILPDMLAERIAHDRGADVFKKPLECNRPRFQPLFPRMRVTHRWPLIPKACFSFRLNRSLFAFQQALENVRSTVVRILSASMSGRIFLPDVEALGQTCAAPASTAEALATSEALRVQPGGPTASPLRPMRTLY